MRRVGEGLGWSLSYVAGERRVLVQRHLERVLGPVPDLERRSREAFASYGRYWAEVFWMRPRRKATVVAHGTVEGAEHAYAALDAGNGLILALPHLGNWEAAGAKADAIGLRTLAAAEALSNQLILDWFKDVRAACGIDVVIVGKGSGVTTQLMRRLRENGVVALVADRDVTGKGVEVDFFGEVTTMPAGAVALADRTGAVLLPVGCYFASGRGHIFVIEAPVEIPAGEDRSDRILAGTQLLARRLESIIRRAPEQWHLFQPNWPSDREPT
jgi:KDO2-lipid IV(A) lauroyltransferase